MSILVGDAPLVRDGMMISADAARSARKVMRTPTYTMRLRVGTGKGTATVVTSDLTEAYVRFNSAYSS